MNIRAHSILWTSLGMLTMGVACHHLRVTQVSLADLPRPTELYGIRTRTPYRVDAYIEAAGRLQAMGEKAACERLLIMGAQDDADYDKIAVLCKMLFAKRPGSEFIRPSMGGAVFIGGTHYSDWPLEPIEIIDGVPFIIVRGYSVFGASELPFMYVRYCMTNCNWSSIRFEPKSEEQKKKAMLKLIASPKWQLPLEQEDRDYFNLQIQ